MATLTVSSTVQTGSTVSAGTAAGSIKSQNRTFSLTGIKNTTYLAGDSVQIWSSNDGGTSYQPLCGPNGGIVQLTYGHPLVTITDASDHYAAQRTGVATGSTLVAVGFNGEAL